MSTNDSEAPPRLIKLPALNVVHLCGTIESEPRSTSPRVETPYAVFDLRVRAYRASKKAKVTVVSVLCIGDLATLVLSRLHTGTVVLLTGSLQNQSSAKTLHVTASTLQVLA